MKVKLCYFAFVSLTLTVMNSRSYIGFFQFQKIRVRELKKLLKDSFVDSGAATLRKMSRLQNLSKCCNLCAALLIDELW
jgi:hypothetical protein